MTDLPALLSLLLALAFGALGFVLLARTFAEIACEVFDALRGWL